MAAVLATTWVAYAPGLRGGFLFDDFANLPSLGATGPVHNWPAFWRYITSGNADPTGRPVTLLSFLLDARDWPADPFPFKRTNLILHLLNGTLLAVLLTKLGGYIGAQPRRTRIAAIFGSAIWLLHPLLVSTTLYIVQREAMLPATFVMLGLMVWLHGRDELARGHLSTGTLWSTAGIAVFTLLGTLAKANGVLLPVFILLVDFVVLAPRHPILVDRTRRAHRLIMSMFAGLPAAAIFLYLIWTAVHSVPVGGDSGFRPWTIAQRLMTEPRILFDYLGLLWLPRPYSSGLFNDQYVASTSLWHPVTTLPALLAIVALIVFAWRARRERPALALAILFFFAGHLIESTSIPLELYFEHRNYVPALLMFWPLGLWLSDFRKLRAVKSVLLVGLPLALAGVTHASASVWGDERTQAMIWARVNPDSPRAQVNAAQMEIANGRPSEAAHLLETMLASKPSEVQLTFNLVGARCLTGGLHPQDLAMATEAMRNSRNPGSLTTHWFERMIPVAREGTCPGLGLDQLLGLIDAGLENGHLNAPGSRQDLRYLRGSLLISKEQPDAALSEFKRALDLQVRPGIALQSAATLGSNGYPLRGLQILDYYNQVRGRESPPGLGMPMLHAWVLTRQDYWQHELDHLRMQLQRDAETRMRNNSINHSI